MPKITWCKEDSEITDSTNATTQKDLKTSQKSEIVSDYNFNFEDYTVSKVMNDYS